MTKIRVTDGARYGELVTSNGDSQQMRDFVYVGNCFHSNYLPLIVDHRPGIDNAG